MFSKYKVSWGSSALAAAFFIFSGCSVKVGEAPPPVLDQKFSGAECLSMMSPIVSAYLNGEASNSDINNAWSCVGGAVEKFKRYVRGRTADRYTSQELATFLENNFFETKKAKPITPALQADFMKVKLLFLGGSDEYITRQEIDQLILLFRDLQKMTLDLNPYMKVLALNWNVTDVKKLKEDVKYFEDSNRELQRVTRELAVKIEKNGNSYKVSDFVSLANNLQSSFGEGWTWPNTVATYVPLVKKVKRALAGGNENIITATEWPRFLMLSSRGYFQYLRYFYFIKSAPETGGGYRLSYLSSTVEDVLSVFQELVSEKPENVVTQAEVFDLLSTFEIVWPEFKVSPKLVSEAMKVKRLFIGGDTNSFTARDFETARLKVKHLRALVERFLPFYAIYGLEWDYVAYQPEEAQKIFMESQFVLEGTARELGALFEGTYDLNDLAVLIQEVESLYPKRLSANVADTVQKALPLLIDVKNMLFKESGSTVGKKRLSDMLGFTSRFYSDYLYYHYFVKDRPFSEVSTVAQASVFANQSLNILRDLMSIKEGAQFSPAELKQLSLHLIDMDLLPKAVKSESFDAVIEVALNNILVAPEVRLLGGASNTLNLSSLEVLRQELQVWLDAELFIARLTNGWAPTAGLPAKDILVQLQKAQADTANSAYLQAALNELIMAIRSPFPITFDSEGRVVITKYSVPLFTRGGLHQLNMNRAISRLLSRSFSDSRERLYNYEGLALGELERPYGKIFPLAVQMGWLTPKDSSFAASRFREANVFVPHADGNSFASFAEMTDLVGMMWSGVRINSVLRKEIIKTCFNGVEQKDSVSVPVPCARAANINAMPVAMASTPDYLKYMSTVSKNEWGRYMENVFKAAGAIPDINNNVVLEDLSLAPHVIQYTEIIFAMFDQNRDGFINTAEARKAFPVFKGVLKEVAKGELESGIISERDLLDVFTFILRFGKPPETVKEKIYYFFSWRGQPEKWNVRANRIQLSKILGYIAERVN